MRTMLAWLLLIISWGVALDSAIHAVWNWMKLGSFGYHVPWILVLIVSAVSASWLALRNDRRVVFVVVAFLPSIILLLVR